MIRDFMIVDDTSPLGQLLGRFKLQIPQPAGSITVLEFKVLTPDSFLWRLLIGKTVYYLYAEDFIEGMDDVRHKLARLAKSSANLEFIKVREREEFEDAEPVKAATLYKIPSSKKELMKFAASSGYDFVFLCKSSENGNDAYFNT